MTDKPTTRRESATPAGAGSSTRSAAGGAISDFAVLPTDARAALTNAGFTSKEKVAEASDADLLKIKGVEGKVLKQLREIAPEKSEGGASAGADLGSKAAEVSDNAEKLFEGANEVLEKHGMAKPPQGE